MAWAPSLGLSLSFNLDGLGLLFALLITGDRRARRPLRQPVSGGSSAGRPLLRVALRVHGRDARRRAERQHPHAVRVLGTDRLHVVPADRLRARARRCAGGGAAGADRDRRRRPGAAGRRRAARRCVGHHEPAAMAVEPARPSPRIRSMPRSRCLVLLAAFTKSAQVPFHFWLPNAMAAPTPVSAYLHSATMVKAGVYLIARMTPILGATAAVDRRR